MLVSPKDEEVEDDVKMDKKYLDNPKVKADLSNVDEPLTPSNMEPENIGIDLNSDVAPSITDQTPLATVKRTRIVLLPTGILETAEKS